MRSKSLITGVILVLFTSLATLPCVVHSEKLDLEWEREYVTDAFPISMSVDNNGNTIVSGRIIHNDSDRFLMKCDRNGSLEWNKVINTTVNESWDGIAVDTENNIIAVGQSYNYNGVEIRGYRWYQKVSRNIIICKYDEDGNNIWNKTFLYDKNLSVYDISLDSNNDIIVVGQIDNDFMISKFSENGEMLWNISYGGEYKESLSSVAIDSQGNIIVAGTILTQNTVWLAVDLQNTSSKYYTAKFDNSGHNIWEREINLLNGQNSNDKYHFYATDVTIASQDTIVVTGGFYKIEDISASDFAFLTVAYSADGKLLWKTVYDIKRGGFSSPVISGGPKGVFVVGNELRDIIILYYNNDGTELCKKYYGENNEKESGYVFLFPRDIKIDKHSNPLILLHSHPQNKSLPESIALIKYSFTDESQNINNGINGFEFIALLAAMAAVVLVRKRKLELKP